MSSDRPLLIMESSSFASPQNDIATWRTAPKDAGRLPPHLTAFIQSGVSPAMGACFFGRPIVGHGVACRVEQDGTIRVLACRKPNQDLLAAIEAGSIVSATFTATRNHMSIQIKAAVATVRPIRSDDQCEAARQCALLADGLVELGYSRAQATAFIQYDSSDLVTIEFLPERVFTQAPGPGVGAELTS